MSAEITMAEITDLADPKLRGIAMRIVKEMELAVQKTVAHKAEPANFPLPQDPNSVEQIVQSRFQKLHPAQQQLAVAKILPLVKANNAIRSKAFGNLAHVDLRSAIPVAKQAADLPFPEELKMSLATLQKIADVHGQVVQTNPGGVVVQPTTDKLELRIHKVRCVDETGKDFNPFGDEPGSDEISLGGTTVDESGDTEKVVEFKVGDFDDGDVKNFSPPRRFTSFDLREGTDFPKSYFVTFVLAEKDFGDGLGDFLNRLLEQVKQKVIAALAAVVGGTIGASGGPIGAAIGTVVGFVVGKVFEFFKSVFADDIFPPKTVSVAIPSLAHRFAGGQTDSLDVTTRFVGHDGTYDITYDWRMFA